jgi:hypothetical protein
LLSKYFDQNPHELKDFVGTIVHGVMPNVIPTAVLPVFETMTNHNLFMDRSIIPDHLQNVAPEMQYDEYTSRPAKIVASILGYVPGKLGAPSNSFVGRLGSPMIIDNWIHEWSGTAGQYALKTMDAVGIYGRQDAETGSKPALTLADIPFVKAFIARNPGQNMQPIQDFYDAYNHATMIQNTAKTMEKQGRPDLAAQYLQDNQGEAFKLEPIHQAIGAQAALVKAIAARPDLSPTEKRQLIDTAYYQMWNMAKQGVRIINEQKKAQVAGSR